MKTTWDFAWACQKDGKLSYWRPFYIVLLFPHSWTKDRNTCERALNPINTGREGTSFFANLTQLDLDSLDQMAINPRILFQIFGLERTKKNVKWIF